MEPSSEYSPSFAISDIDGYHILFYTNYLKFNHRAALQAFVQCKRLPLSLDIHIVHSLKYLKPVKWGDAVSIRSSILHVESGEDDRSRVTMYHEWTRKPNQGEGLETCNQAVIEYNLRFRASMARQAITGKLESNCNTLCVYIYIYWTVIIDRIEG